jgi:Zn-dependent protease with chaperone function
MSGVEGRYFYPKSARFVPARAVLTGDRRIQILDTDGGVLGEAHVKEVRVSERLGNIPRHIRFADGADFETADNDGLDELLRGTGHGRSFVDRLERSWRWVAVSVVIAGAATAAFLQYGIPALSYSLAQATPPEVAHTVSEETLQALDRTWLRPSKLTDQQQAAATALFARVTSLQKNPKDYRLAFRDAPGIGPNAFALPDGTIVVTDEIWPLVKEDAEIEGVFAHEIAHVNHKHGLQSLYQASLIPAAIAVVTGDASQVAQIAAILPGILLQSAYSRRFEQQADDDAAQALAKAGEDPAALAHLLQRMEKSACAKKACAPSWLGNHPETSERVLKLLQATKPAHVLPPSKTMPIVSAEQLKAQNQNTGNQKSGQATTAKNGRASGGGGHAASQTSHSDNGTGSSTKPKSGGGGGSN